MLMTAEAKSVLSRLEEWKRRVDQILRMFDGGFMPATNRAKSMRLYKSLKDDLEQEHKRFKGARAKDATAAETRWYLRPLGRIATYSGARWDRAPEQWRPFLNEAHTEFAMAISKMKGYWKTNG